MEGTRTRSGGGVRDRKGEMREEEKSDTPFFFLPITLLQCCCSCVHVEYYQVEYLYSSRTCTCTYSSVIGEMN